MNTLNIIGAGHVGQTLGALFQKETFVIGGVCNRSLSSGQFAVNAIGGGTAVADLSELSPGNVFMIATGDDAIQATCIALVKAVDVKGAIVLHCSGSLPSSLLGAARDAGAAVASVHPIKSFADVEASIETFAGTFCGVEGDAEALAVLEPAFRSIGGKRFSLIQSRRRFTMRQSFSR